MNKLADWQQNYSWNWGYVDGKRGREYKCRWWADEQMFALGYMQGKCDEMARRAGKDPQPLISQEMIERVRSMGPGA
jgi:hypothetical protein